MNEALTHAFLIEKAAAWLRAKGNTVVITDMTHGGGETPDAIGWRGWGSTLIECKASRADFLADRHKYFRRMPEMGMGGQRYYCAPIGLIKPTELPKAWGLLEWNGKKLVTTVKSGGSARSAKDEISILVSAIRRIGAQCPVGVSVKAYTMDSKGRATLGIQPTTEESSVPQPPHTSPCPPTPISDSSPLIAPAASMT